MNNPRQLLLESHIHLLQEMSRQHPSVSDDVEAIVPLIREFIPSGAGQRKEIDLQLRMVDLCERLENQGHGHYHKDITRIMEDIMVPI